MVFDRLATVNFQRYPRPQNPEPKCRPLVNKPPPLQKDKNRDPNMGNSQNWDPILVPLHERCRTIIYNAKGPTILRATNIEALKKEGLIHPKPYTMNPRPYNIKALKSRGLVNPKPYKPYNIKAFNRRELIDHGSTLDPAILLGALPSSMLKNIFGFRIWVWGFGFRV